MNGSVEIPAEPRRLAEPMCPQCGGKLEPVRYTGGYLNRDQWDSQRAGDYFCRACPTNERGNTALCYWWTREVNWPEPTPETTCRVCDQQLRDLHRHTLEEALEQRDEARAQVASLTRQMVTHRELYRRTAEHWADAEQAVRTEQDLAAFTIEALVGIIVTRREAANP